MKKLSILIIFFVFSSIYLYSKDDLSGVYYNDSGICLKMNDNKFELIMTNASRNGYYSDTIAIGGYNRINKSFIELNNINELYFNCIENIIYTQRQSNQVDDSICIKFSIPYDRGDLDINIFTNTFKNYTLKYSSINKKIMIPQKDIKYISFFVHPDYIMPHTTEGLFYGIIEFNSLLEYSINDKNNLIEIQLPFMHNSFFEKYYIKSEYARVEGDKIFWKGEIYTRQK